MKLKASLVIAVLAVGLSAVVAVAAPSAQAKTGGSYQLPGTFSGTASNDTITGAASSGTVTITSFKMINGVLNAVGTFTGTIAGVESGNTFTSAFTAPVTQIDGHTLSGGALSAAAAAPTSCNVLSLTLGPLHLDLLGLVVDLNQVNLNITAQPGPGNLLGNLLCQVAGLLDNSGGTGGLTGLLQGIASLLNQILAQL
jgi:hypothetical protein